MTKRFCPYCGEPLENHCDCAEIAEMEAQDREDQSWEDPYVREGWAQQDLIDLYRSER
jgi:hypothetical protein